MASIAYVTDGNMIEFHRLNGHRTMNFWRPTSNKKFADFNQGDVLFFLAKGTERGKTREKGIVGFGRFAQAHSMSFTKMWNTYGIENGYATKEDLYDAILKVSKSGMMPKMMNCLYLVDVAFFQVPVYLSEIGMNISNRIESYIYLDKEDPGVTAKLLKRANETSGLDMWTMALSDQNSQEIFQKEEIRHQLSVLSQKCFVSLHSEKEKRTIQKIRKNCFAGNERLEGLKGSKEEMLQFEDDSVTIFYPFAASGKNYEKRKQLLIGHIWTFNELVQSCSLPFSVSYQICMDKEYKQLEEELNQMIAKIKSK